MSYDDWKTRAPDDPECPHCGRRGIISSVMRACMCVCEAGNAELYHWLDAAIAEVDELRERAVPDDDPRMVEACRKASDLEEEIERRRDE